MIRSILAATLLLSSPVSAEVISQWGTESQTENSRILWVEGEGGLHIGDVIYENRRSSAKTLQFIGEEVLFVVQTPYGQVNIFVLPRKDIEPDRLRVDPPYGVSAEPEMIESKEGDDAVISLWLPMS